MRALPAIGLALLLATTHQSFGRQRTTYEIEARLNESTALLSATETVRYWNNSPHTVQSLRFHLYPNAFSSSRTEFARNLEKAGRYEMSWADHNELGGIDITRLESDAGPLETRLHETEMEVVLAESLVPGDSVVMTLEFTLKIPSLFSSCLGRRGRHFIFGSWYPQLVERVRAGSHSGCSADYDVSITLPADQMVAATGTLLNGKEERNRMKWPPEFRHLSQDSTKTLRFRAKDVSSFAWVASPDFVLVQDRISGTNINILTRDRNRFTWLGVPAKARAILARYSDWYGPCPRHDLTVVDASGIAPEDASYPGLVIISQQSLPFTRLLEKALARQLACQWFSVPFSLSHPSDSSFVEWLSTGPAAFSEIRYLEERYGSTNLLDLPTPAGPLSGLGAACYQRAIYYIAASNSLLEPLASPAPDHAPFILSEARHAQAGGLFLMLQKMLGAEAFDQALRSYLERSRKRTPAPADFIAACSEAAEKDMSWFFNRWLGTSGTCDYGVTGARRRGNDIEIGIRRVGEIAMPLEAELAFADGTTERLYWNSDRKTGVLRLATPRMLNHVTLDPDHKLLEPNRWNNHWPRQVEVRPVIALPSLDAYQIFYGPYAWYDAYHGFQLGAWAQGREFIDAGPLRGRHMWTLSETYSTKIRDWHTGASYQTPLSFVSDRLRISFLGDYSLMAAGVRLNLVQELGRAFQKPDGKIDLGYRFLDLYNLEGRDTTAWDSARTAEIRLRLSHSYETRYFNGGQNFYLGRGLTKIGGNYSYWKTSIEQIHALRLSRSLSIVVRGFGGAIWGQIPNQNQFYLSGGLAPNSAEPISWGYQGISSGQEHWHYDADANLRGWAGQYLHGRFAYGLNIHLRILPFLLPFFDIGNIGDTIDSRFWDARMDAGVRLKLGWLYADFPLWRCHNGKSEFSPNWMLGLKLTGLAGF